MNVNMNTATTKLTAALKPLAMVGMAGMLTFSTASHAIFSSTLIKGAGTVASIYKSISEGDQQAKADARLTALFNRQTIQILDALDEVEQNIINELLKYHQLEVVNAYSAYLSTTRDYFRQDPATRAAHSQPTLQYLYENFHVIRELLNDVNVDDATFYEVYLNVLDIGVKIRMEYWGVKNNPTALQNSLYDLVAVYANSDLLQYDVNWRNHSNKRFSELSWSTERRVLATCQYEWEGRPSGEVVLPDGKPKTRTEYAWATYGTASYNFNGSQYRASTQVIDIEPFRANECLNENWNGWPQIVANHHNNEINVYESHRTQAYSNWLKDRYIIGKKYHETLRAFIGQAPREIFHSTGTIQADIDILNWHPSLLLDLKTTDLSGDTSINSFVNGEQYRLNWQFPFRGSCSFIGDPNIAWDHFTPRFSSSQVRTANGSQTFKLDCHAGEIGTFITTSHSISAVDALSFGTYNPSIDVGQSTTLYWDFQGQGSCSITGAESVNVSTSGTRTTKTFHTPGNYNYNMTCTGTGPDAAMGTIRRSISISVHSSVPPTDCEYPHVAAKDDEITQGVATKKSDCPL